MSRQEELSLKSDKSPRFIEKHKQHFIDILLFMEATKMKKLNNCVIYHNCFCNGEFISHCILCNYLLYTWRLNFHQEIKYNYNNVKYIMINGIILYSEFLIPDLRSNFRLLEFLGTDLQPF